MTYAAILNTSDDQPKKDLNLTKLGDRISLRAFCERCRNLQKGTDHVEESREAKKTLPSSGVGKEKKNESPI